MSRSSTRFRTILPTSGRAALGATIAGGVLSGLTAAPERVGRLFRRRFPTVAVTGMTGVGKTQLADRLSRRTSGDGVGEVGSAVMERRTRRSRRLQGFRFLVVPGDNAATRLSALDEVFHDEPVDGVIHVVANGHATPRRVAGTTGLATATREEQLAAELEDWAITSHRIASMAVRRDKPVWLVIAVTKTDLYADELDDVVRYYSRGVARRSATRSTSCGRSPAARSSRSTCSRCRARAATAPRPSRPRRPARWWTPWRSGWPSSAATSDLGTRPDRAVPGCVGSDRSVEQRPSYDARPLPRGPRMSESSTSSPGRALVVGATGIVGQSVARRLVDEGWETYGLSRSGTTPHPDVRPVRADLGDPAGPGRGARGRGAGLRGDHRVDPDGDRGGEHPGQRRSRPRPAGGAVAGRVGASTSR